MADLLTLTETKLHLRVDHDDEDTLIQGLMAAATAATADYLHADSLDDTAAAPIKAAALLLVGDLYANREAQTDRPLHRNPTFDRLLNPYREMEA